MTFPLYSVYTHVFQVSRDEATNITVINGQVESQQHNVYNQCMKEAGCQKAMSKHNKFMSKGGSLTPPKYGTCQIGIEVMSLRGKNEIANTVRKGKAILWSKRYIAHVTIVLESVTLHSKLCTDTYTYK